ncbi:hypothetical protein K438DRAFT_2008808 [Mycena galopus ATCC 62051]|nr:hypothetical protein K438DRAFT_2008808 [Mycena galopus ATCC 62051]
MQFHYCNPLNNSPRQDPYIALGCDWCGIVFVIAIIIHIVWGFKITIDETIATQCTLLSRIPNDAPISGFYGPGAWWAWLITLGMTHGHMGVAFVTEGYLAPEWDYDLIAAGGYIIAASIDLILKSRAIVQLGEGAHESPLLPALICAERVVIIGTGSSLFTVATSLFGGSSGVRRAATAAIPLLLALVASFFALRAHEAISRVMPVIWCRLHDGVKLGQREIPFTTIDFPAVVLDAAVHMPELYISRDYWIYNGGLCAVVAVLAPVVNLLRRRNLIHALRSAGYGLALLAFIAAVPLLALAALPVFGAMQWLSGWVMFWVPIYILAFFPQMGYFPLTGMSIVEMDQLAALLSVAFIAVLRSFHRVLEAVRSHPPRSSHEFVPLLP